MPATRTKPARTLRVLSSLTAHLVVVAVDEGRRHDEYTVSSADGAVWVSHTADPARRYRVHCEAGVPERCDCPAGYYGRECRHVALSRVLVARSDLLPPADDADERETVADTHEEAAERDAWYASAGTLSYEPLGL